MQNGNFKMYQKPSKSSPINKNAKFTINTVKKDSKQDHLHLVQGVLAEQVDFLDLEEEEEDLVERSISVLLIRMIFSLNSSPGWVVDHRLVWLWMMIRLLGGWEDDRDRERVEGVWEVWEVECLECLNLLLLNLKLSDDHYRFPLKSISPCVDVANGSLYTGTTKRLKITRKQNDGSGRLATAENVLEVNIKPGWKAGTKIRFPNAGDEMILGHAQTIAFVIEEKAHPTYKRDGDDLSTEMEISLVEAFAGFTKDLKTLDGRTLKVSSPSGTVVQPGQIKLFSGEGMPNQRTGGKGSLRVKLNIKFPKTATKEEVNGIKQLFG
jgi:hypothetical protein